MSVLRNLDSRESDGISVSLDWNPIGNFCVVTVTTATKRFTLIPANGDVLDCFHHPYPYLDMHGDSLLSLDVRHPVTQEWIR